MKITVQDLERHYASLDDYQLLRLDREDLTEIARPCYDAEMGRRGLLPPEPEPPPIAVATFPDLAAASLARTVLEAAKIQCFLEGTRLMVPAKLVNRARGLLEADEDAPPDGEQRSGTLDHRFLETNGIRLHYAEGGHGPLVLLLHGFPECWHSWRHQLLELASRGYHVVAPDLRGFGQSDRPQPVDAYDIFHVTGDIVGIVNALAEGPATLVGHDWGSMIAWHAGLFRPDLFPALALLSVPYAPRRTMSQSQWEAEKYPGKVFYQAMLRSPQAEAFFASDLRARLTRGLWQLSGDVPAEHRWQPATDPGIPPAALPLPARLPYWLNEKDIDYLEGEYRRTGFTGGLNYYRNCDRNWELTPFLAGARLPQPTLFLAGERDPVLSFLGDELAALETNVPNLWKKVLLPRAGHWIQQERPDDVNSWLGEFLTVTTRP